MRGWGRMHARVRGCVHLRTYTRGGALAHVRLLGGVRQATRVLAHHGCTARHARTARPDAAPLLAVRAQALREEGYPELRPLLCMGGVDSKTQNDVIRAVRI